MGKDEALRTCLLALSVVMVAVGIWTFSFKKMLATYFFGILGIAGILLPDWEFFDRDYSEWFSPLPARRTPGVDPAPTSWRLELIPLLLLPFLLIGGFLFKLYPMRVAMITLIYGFGLYKWWKYISS